MEAKEAKALAMSISDENTKAELEMCYNIIKISASKGEFKTMIDNKYLSDNVTLILEAKGYIVNRESHQRDGTWTVIKW